MSSSEPDRAPGAVLKSNVGAVQSELATRQPRTSVLPFVLGGLLLFVLGVASALLWSSTQQRTREVSTANAAATALSRPTVVSVPLAGVAAARLPDINGISCDALESTIVHIHVHLAVFIDGEEQLIPFGVGISQPWQVSDNGDGPFVVDGSCFYWLHTHTDDGVIHIESPVRRRFTLGDFFAIWQVPLSQDQVGPAHGQLITYVNGQRDSTNPTDLTLLPHEQIQLDIGADVPPYHFEFAPGD